MLDLPGIRDLVDDDEQVKQQLSQNLISAVESIQPVLAQRDRDREAREQMEAERDFGAPLVTETRWRGTN